MKKASEYRQHAEHCRQLARSMEGEQREQLLQMAAHWDRLAEQRVDLVNRYPELDESEAREPA
jgi:hypothetical protein